MHDTHLKRFIQRWRGIALFVVLCLPLAAHPATIQLVNLDGAGEGFNDPAVFTPVGGNTATTLGQARFNAFQHAANIVAGLLTSGVTIRVEINMNPMGGTATSATLGGAGPNTVFRDFSGALVAGTWYVEALANKLAGTDLGSVANGNPNTNDIGAEFNSDVDNGTVLGATNWYYGLDGNPGGHIDFVSVVLHELVHGLGFSDLVDLATGAKLPGSDGVPYDDAYMRHLEHHGATPSGYPSMTNAQRVTASTSDPNLHWTGPAVTAASGTLSAGVSGGHVRMYGPNPQDPGSSVAHFSTALSPNQLMEPNYTGPIQTLGLAAQLLADIGWSGTAPPSSPSPPPPPPPPPPPSSPSPPPPVTTMPLPTAPAQFSCVDAGLGITGSTTPASARPLGVAVSGGMAYLQLGFVAFAAAVDIYVVVRLPSAQLLVLNSAKQWLPYPANAVPYRANSAQAVNSELLWQSPISAIPPGAYAAYAVVVATGTNPASFSLGSPSYLWCATKSFP